MSEQDRVCIYLDIVRTLKNPFYNFLLHQGVKLTRFNSLVRKISDQYERKPISLDIFPSTKEAFCNIIRPSA